MNSNKEGDSPNIILIVLDTFRSDKINGEKKELTPFINNLLNNSIYFKNCFTNSPWTYPSHSSMFTGLYHSQNRLLSKNIFKLSKKVPVLAEIMKDLGYYNMCYTENVWINKYSGLTKGFDKVFQSNLTKGFDTVISAHPTKKTDKVSQYRIFSRKVDVFLKKKLGSKFFFNLWSLLKKSILDKLIIKIIKKLFWKELLFQNDSIKDLKNFCKSTKDNLDKKPFFLFFNLMATHTPYVPPIDVINRFNIKMRELKFVKSYFLYIRKNIIKVNVKKKLLSTKTVRIFKKLYNACVYYADLLVKEIIQNLQKFNLLNDSYIIITSDHGEFFGHQLDLFLWEHTTFLSLNESVIKVPLLIHNSNFKKKKITSQVQSKDLFHTILHLTGIQKEYNKYLNLKNSFLYQVKKNSTPKYIFGEYLKFHHEVIEISNRYRSLIKEENIHKIFQDIFFLRSNEYKYIIYGNKYE